MIARGALLSFRMGFGLVLMKAVKSRVTIVERPLGVVKLLSVDERYVEMRTNVVESFM